MLAINSSREIFRVNIDAVVLRKNHADAGVNVNLRMDELHQVFLLVVG